MFYRVNHYFLIRLSRDFNKFTFTCFGNDEFKEFFMPFFELKKSCESIDCFKLDIIFTPTIVSNIKKRIEDFPYIHKYFLINGELPYPSCQIFKSVFRFNNPYSFDFFMDPEKRTLFQIPLLLTADESSHVAPSRSKLLFYNR